jgi:hypothetical protein
MAGWPVILRSSQSGNVVIGFDAENVEGFGVGDDAVDVVEPERVAANADMVVQSWGACPKSGTDMAKMTTVR